MRSAYRLNLTGPGAIWAPSALLVLALLVFAFAPMRPVATAQAKAANVAVGTSANMMFAAGITKDSVPPTGSAVVPGQVIVYNITASNGTPSLTTASAGGFVRITDTAPAGTLFQNAAVNQQPQFGSAWSCVIGGGGTTLTCSAGDGTGAGIDTFTVQETLKIRVEAVVQPATPEGTVLTNTATFSFSASGGAPTELITSNATTHVVLASADLAADLSASKAATPVVDPDGAGPLAPVPLPVVGPNVPPGSVNSGGYIRYDVPFGNSGPADAINVLITDQISGNTAFVGALATAGVFVPAAQPPAVPFTFTIQAVDTVAPLGPSVSLTCTVTGAAGSQALYCRPQGNTGLPAPGPYADGTLPAGYNGTLTFFLRVNESVAGGTIVSNPANITSGLCRNGAGPNPPVFPPVPCASTSDPNTSNNTTLAAQTVVIASSNLAISKIVQSAVTTASNPNQTGPIGPATAPNGAALTGTAILPGTSLTYRLIITNNGPSDVSNIRLTDVLPSGLETPPGRVLGVRYVSVNPVLPSGATFTCAPPAGVNPQNNPQGNGGSVVCTAPLLSANAPNNVAAIDITVFIDPATKASLVDTATVDATINNLNRPISGSTVLTTPVAPTSDLALTKTHTADPITTDVTYTVTLTNNGPGAAQMVSMVDTLPPFQRITNVQILATPDLNGAPNFTCTAVPPVGSPGNTTSLTCTAPELPPNKNQNGTVNPSGTVKFLLTVRQDPLTPQPAPTLQNCVSATSMSTDPIPANNTNVCDTVPVSFSAGLTATKTDVPDPVVAGNLLTYTIPAVNNGPSAALNFRITDPLPPGTIFISAVASPGATLTTPAVGINGTVTSVWDAAGGTPAGLTPPGVTRTLTIVVRVCPEVLCNTTLTNTATISSDTPGASATATATTLVQSRSNLSIAKSASPDPVNPDSNLTYTITFANSGPSNSASTVITDVLPAGFEVVSTNSTVPGTTFTQTIGGDTGDQVTVTANVGVLGAANQCTTTRPTSGTITIVAKVPPKYPNGFVTNTATITSGNCLPDPDLSNNTATTVTEVSAGGSPGQAFPAASEASDQKAGSVLFFPLYTSNSSVPARQNTTISLTNVGARDFATIHLFVVDGSSCSAQDVYICLTRNQTMSFRASDFDPSVTGYIVAVVVNENTGRPVAFNCLIGDAYVKFASGHAVNYGAVAVSSLLPNPAGVDLLASSATLKFDGIHYNRLPRILAVGGIPSPSDGNSTLLTLMAVGGNMSLSGAVIGPLTGNLYDDRENNFSFNANAPNCIFVGVLSDNFPRTFVSFNSAIPSGRSGWIKIRAFHDVAILGLLLNFNPNVDFSGSAFNQGHVLHALALTDSATLTIPVDFPACL